MKNLIRAIDIALVLISVACVATFFTGASVAIWDGLTPLAENLIWTGLVYALPIIALWGGWSLARGHLAAEARAKALEKEAAARLAAAAERPATILTDEDREKALLQFRVEERASFAIHRPDNFTKITGA
jgi:hypothetical protein